MRPDGVIAFGVRTTPGDRKGCSAKAQEPGIAAWQKPADAPAEVARVDRPVARAMKSLTDPGAWGRFGGNIRVSGSPAHDRTVPRGTVGIRQQRSRSRGMSLDGALCRPNAILRPVPEPRSVPRPAAAVCPQIVPGVQEPVLDRRAVRGFQAQTASRPG